jgi:hypothetical protein
MDITTFDAYAHLSRPLTQRDERNLRQISSRSELKDVYPVLEHMRKRKLKLEQEALYSTGAAPGWKDYPGASFPSQPTVKPLANLVKRIVPGAHGRRRKNSPPILTRCNTARRTGELSACKPGDQPELNQDR